jgi:hypothetical protein
VSDSLAELRWPARLTPEQVGSAALRPFILPLLVNGRADVPYAGTLKDRLIDLTIRMARSHTSWYADSLPVPDEPVTARTLAEFPLVTRRELTSRRNEFVAEITTFGFATFTGGTTSQAPLMIERAVEEQTYLVNLLAPAMSNGSGPKPLGLVAVNGSHGEVFRVPGHGYPFSINFEQPAAFRKAAWLLQQEFAFPEHRPRISFIQGYFEFIHLLVLYLKEQGIAIEPGRIDSVACYGMAIPPSRRAEVAEFFHCAVSDNFSLGEVHGSAAYDPGDDTYVFSPFVHAEVIDLHSHRPVEHGSGELVVTTLFPFTQRFPLIRYRTGDLVFTPGTVALGPRFRIRGRLTDAISIAEGHILTRGDVAMALEELPFVARLPGFTNAVMNAGVTAGPKFSLTADEPLSAVIEFEVNQSPTAFHLDRAKMIDAVREKLVSVVPDDTKAALMRSPQSVKVFCLS